MTRLLITRPEEDAAALASLLEAIGIACLVEPMLSIETLQDNCAALADALATHPVAILLTSKHGALALAAMSAQRAIPILAVGKITADTSAALGFLDVRPAGGTAHRLIDYVRIRHEPQHGTLLYACGTDISVNIEAELAPQGYKVITLPVYRAIAATTFSPRLLAAVKSQTLDGALFFSQRAAEAYAGLAKGYGIAEHHTHLCALALSEGVASRLRTLPWKTIAVAHKPDLEAMVALCKKIFLKQRYYR